MTTKHADFERIYLAVGRALSRWSLLEWDLAILFCACLGPYANYGEFAFWAVVSFEGKLKMTDAVVRPNLRGGTAAINTEWDVIFNQLTKKNRMRNKIAHGTVLNSEFKRRSKRAKKNYRDETALFPYHWGRRLHAYMNMHHGDIWDGRGIERLSAKQIDEMGNNFSALRTRLQRFRSQIAPLLPPEEDLGSKAG